MIEDWKLWMWYMKRNNCYTDKTLNSSRLETMLNSKWQLQIDVKLVSASLTSITNFIFNRNLVSVYLHIEFHIFVTNSVEVMKRLMKVFVEVQCLSLILVLFEKIQFYGKITGNGHSLCLNLFITCLIWSSLQLDTRDLCQLCLK